MNENSNYKEGTYSFLIACVLSGDVIIFNLLYLLLSMFFQYRTDTIPAHQIMLVCSVVYLLCGNKGTYV